MCGSRQATRRALIEMGTRDEVARHIAPLGWEHISLTGDYSWERGDAAEAGSATAASQLAFLKDRVAIMVGATST